MNIIIGPILKRANGYGFDMWVAGKGSTVGCSYRRIEDSIYARNATISDSLHGCTAGAVVCQTLDEFVARSG